VGAMFVTAKVSGILSGFVGRMFSWSWSAFIGGSVFCILSSGLVPCSQDNIVKAMTNTNANIFSAIFIS
jgi:hypothetical protein